MQPTPSAIERELEALRDIRRRSSAQGGPGTLVLDPDLPVEPPSSAPPLSPQAWAAAAAETKTSPTQSREDDSGSSESGNTSADDPFHLFWVPAHLHPEIAPREFRDFLKEHAREGTAPQTSATLSRSNSSASTSGLGRKSSMLSKQYRPRENDGVENERVVLSRRRSVFPNEGPQLTISDLQKLEELADEDPAKLSRVIRRSLSLNVAPSFLDEMDDVPDNSDDADAPIIVPRPNQILRRAARTKIRKPGLVGDGNGHRFPATRRKPLARAQTMDSAEFDDRTQSPPPLPTQGPKSDEDEEAYNRRLTYTEESSIYDAYAETSEDKETRRSLEASAALIEQLLPPATSIPSPKIAPPKITEPEPEPESISQPQPVLYQPQPQRHLTPITQQPAQLPSRTPSPDGSSASHHTEDSRQFGSRSAEYLPLHGSPPASNEKRKGKDKKGGLLSKLGGGGSDKNAKKSAKENREKEKEKDSGFFGSLFGGGKKKQEETAPSNLGGGAGPATAAALLGASKSSSKLYSPSISPQLGNPYARYPIHVERAVYRLSHIKLANPRRPLYEQVLISNLMFWYLGVINKTQQGPGQTQNQQDQQTQDQPAAPAGGQGEAQDGNGGQGNTGSEKERQEREQREQEEREMQMQRERVEPRREARRGLTKSPAPGSSAAASRRAETPVKGPQYGLQHQVIEQEYGPGPPTLGSGSSPIMRTSSAPPPGNHNSGGYSAVGYSQQRPSSYSQQPANQPMNYTRVDENGDFYYEPNPESRLTNGPSSKPRSPSPVRSNPSSVLPPGAMAPLSSGEQQWMSSSNNPSLPNNNSNRSQRNSTSPPHSYSANSYDSDSSSALQQRSRASRSPPPTNQYSNHEWNRNGGVDRDGSAGGVGGKIPSRSLSANAVAPAQPQQQQQHRQRQPHHHQHNALKKKAPSAGPPPSSTRRPRTADGTGDEDVPLAIWQQQHRK